MLIILWISAGLWFDKGIPAPCSLYEMLQSDSNVMSSSCMTVSVLVFYTLLFRHASQVRSTVIWRLLPLATVSYHQWISLRILQNYPIRWQVLYSVVSWWPRLGTGSICRWSAHVRKCPLRRPCMVCQSPAQPVCTQPKLTLTRTSPQTNFEHVKNLPTMRFDLCGFSQICPGS